MPTFSIDGTGRLVWRTGDEPKARRKLVAEFHEIPGIDARQLALELKGSLEAEAFQHEPAVQTAQAIATAAHLAGAAIGEAAASGTDKATDKAKKKQKVT